MSFRRKQRVTYFYEFFDYHALSRFSYHMTSSSFLSDCLPVLNIDESIPDQTPRWFILVNGTNEIEVERQVFVLK